MIHETAYHDGLRGELVTAATDVVLTVAEAKDRLRRSADSSIEDDQIESLITALTAFVEEDLCVSLLTQTRRIWFDGIPCDGRLLLDRGPVQSITSVKTYDVADVSTTLSSTIYQLDAVSTPARLTLRSGQWWTTSSATALRSVNAVAVEYVAGYGATSTTVPGALKHALLLLVGGLWEHREQVIVAQFAGQFLELPFGYKELTAPYRRWRAA